MYQLHSMPFDQQRYSHQSERHEKVKIIQTSQVSKPSFTYSFLLSHAGPGLAIRVICQMDAYLREDFSTTNTLLAHIVDYHHCSQTPSPMVTLIEQFASLDEKEVLLRVTKECILSATLLPIFSVGVQVSTVSLVIRSALSSSSSLSSSSFLYALAVFVVWYLLLLFLLFSSFSSSSPLSSNLFLFPSYPVFILLLSSNSSSLHALAFLSHLASPLSQGDGRSYNYVAALSSDDEIPWEEIMTLAKLIPRVCHNINR